MTILRSSAALRIACAAGLAILLAVFVFHVLRPDAPGVGLDASWMAVTGEASARRIQWGVDLDFNYGPGAPIVTSYYNTDFFTRTLPLSALILLGFGLLASCIILGRERPRATETFILSAFLVMSIALGQFQAEWVYYGLSFMVLLLGLDRSDRIETAACLLGSLVLGILPLTKLPFAITALPLLCLLDFRQTTLRRLPLFVPVFLAGFFATYLSYGQRPADLVSFVTLQLQAAAGFSEALSLDGDPIDLAMFMGLGAVWLAVTILSFKTAPPSRFDRSALLVTIAFVVYILLKAGFVRQDAGHIPIALTGLATCLLLQSAIVARHDRRLGLGLCVGALVIGLVLTPVEIVKYSDQGLSAATLDVFYKTRVRDAFRSNAKSFVADVTDLGHLPERLRQTNAATWRQIRALSQMPTLEGTVDIIPSEQSGLLASGADYHPRPSFQEYGTYTARLIAANRAFLAGPSAPNSVIFAPGSIDERYPATAEGGSWPELLTRYEPIRLSGELLVLRHRDRPVPDALGPAQHHAIRFGESLATEAKGPVFAKITVKPNLLGRLASLLFHSPILRMNVVERNGLARSFRFIPEIAAAGFLLSPMIEDSWQFAALGVGLEEDLRDREIVSISLDRTRWTARLFDRSDRCRC